MPCMYSNLRLLFSSSATAAAATATAAASPFLSPLKLKLRRPSSSSSAFPLLPLAPLYSLRSRPLFTVFAAVERGRRGRRLRHSPDFARGRSRRAFYDDPGRDKKASMEEGAAGFNRKRAEGRDRSDGPRKELQLKKRPRANPVSTISYVQILGTGMDTQDTSSSVLLFFDHQRFIFNAGEGLQRFCTEHKIKLSKIDHIFLSRVCSETSGGLPGLLLTLAGIGDEGMSVNIWGPSDLKYLVDAMKSFIPNAAMVHTNSFGPAPSSDAAAVPDLNKFADPIILVDDDVVKISALLMWPEESGQNNGVHSAMRPGDMSVVYVCELPELKGKFHPERAKEKGLRPGPEYRELQLGKSVFSKKLNITVHPSDVMDPSIPGPVVLLVDCPTQSHFQRLSSLGSLNDYYADFLGKETQKAVTCVIHLSPALVVSSPDYTNWMKRFGSAQHIIAGHEMKNIEIPILSSSSRIAARLNYLCPQLFPASGFWSLKQSDSVHLSEGTSLSCPSISAENLLKFTLRPRDKIGLDKSYIPNRMAHSNIIDELHTEIPEIVDAAQYIHHLWNGTGETGEERRFMQEEPWLSENSLPNCLENKQKPHTHEAEKHHSLSLSLCNSSSSLPMVPLLSPHAAATAATAAPLFFAGSPPLSAAPLSRYLSARRRARRLLLLTGSLSSDRFRSIEGRSGLPQPRTLFPGGYKRPEIKVPTLVLQLDPDDVLDGSSASAAAAAALDSIDEAVSGRVGIVVLGGGEGTGKRLYEAACLLKSVVRDRAYLLIAERVDIVSAINASGVLLSDQGLPAIVARSMMADSRSESVVLPLVARNVQTASAASSASTSDGADFLICDIGEENHEDNLVSSMFEDVKIPIFVKLNLSGNGIALDEASRWIKYGASGLVIGLKHLDLFTDGLLHQLFSTISTLTEDTKFERGIPNKVILEEMGNDFFRNERVAGFVKLEDKEKQLIETEKVVLLEAVNVIQKAAPQMEEVSLLVDATSHIDEPFLLVIVGEFNSGKSTFINALLGERYLKEGVVPTTNEITFLRYSESDSDEKQRCERHPDGQYICYIPAPILKEMIIVDTPGTNVILQRQQRLTEEFIPRADLLIFVISADRPLTESEVAFLRYTQQWRKKVVFVLNKSDIYQNDLELQEATSFISENVQNLLNAENVALYPISARSALESKLSASYESAKEYTNMLVSDSRWRVGSFYKLEKFLYSFLDGSTSMGMERIKLKLETPIGIAERLVSSCETVLRQDYEDAKQDLNTVLGIVSSVKEYVMKMERDSISWRRKILSLVDTTKSRVVELTESSLQLSNLDLVATYVFKGEKSATMPATAKVQNDILGPALLDANKLLIDYVSWLHSSNDSQGRLYRESFEKRWPSLVHSNTQMTLERFDLLRKLDEQCLKVIENFSASSASKTFDQEIREVFLGTFGGLGAAGLSASLLTSVLDTTLEDLLALGLCSAGGLLAISNFPARRQVVVNKVNKTVDALARDLEEAMQKDLLDTVTNMENFINIISKPYQEAAQSRLDKILKLQDELSAVQDRLRMLQIEIQNLHTS